jgi:two-component system, LytTR family, sensor kinase
LEALRLKLNPHFLFNALNGATMLIRSGENARAIEAVVGLSTLLRQLLEERETLVPLDKELAFIESYVDVERVRLGDRLTMVVDASREARGARVPFLTLQPLVENSIRHGIAPRGAGGQITIEARRAGDWLDLHVLNDAAASPAAARGFGVGLETTRQRLAQLFGDGYELSLDVRETSRTTAVHVRVPYFTEAFEQHE